MVLIRGFVTLYSEAPKTSLSFSLHLWAEREDYVSTQLFTSQEETFKMDILDHNLGLLSSGTVRKYISDV